MKKRNSFFAFSAIALFIIFLFATCSSNNVIMPYSTDEYKLKEWTEESLVKHLNELGFENIKITNVAENYGNEEWKIQNIKIEDPHSTAWFDSYRTFDKDEKFDKDSKILVETYVSHPTLNTNNSEALMELVNNGNIDIRDPVVSNFFESHNGEYIEFNGVITNCYDALFYINSALDFCVKIENSSWLEYSWDDIKISDLHECGWYINYNTYSCGTLSKGVNVHMVCQIHSLGDYWSLEIKKFDTK